MLLFFELNFGCRTNLDDCYASSKFGETFLKFLAIPVAIRVVDFTFDLSNASFYVGTVAGSFNECGFVFGDNDFSR